MKSSKDLVSFIEEVREKGIRLKDGMLFLRQYSLHRPKEAYQSNDGTTIGYREMPSLDTRLEFGFYSKPVTCRSYKRYKGIHKPRCCGGIGCIPCWQKYNDKHPMKPLDTSEEEADSAYDDFDW